MRFREDKPADLERARAAVAQWREQHPTGTEDEMIAALGSQFHPEYGPVLRATLFALERHRTSTSTSTGADPVPGTRPAPPPPAESPGQPPPVRSPWKRCAASSGTAGRLPRSRPGTGP